MSAGFFHHGCKIRVFACGELDVVRPGITLVLPQRGSYRVALHPHQRVLVIEENSNMLPAEFIHYSCYETWHNKKLRTYGTCILDISYLPDLGQKTYFYLDLGISLHFALRSSRHPCLYVWWGRVWGRTAWDERSRAALCFVICVFL